jgi:phage recombination protein Bet
MNNLATQQNNALTPWEDAKKLEEIRKLFAPKLTEMEFQFFVGLGKSANLNPFLREIWSVKYQDNAPAQVFIGRDGYRKAAQGHSQYDYHQCDAVYANDVFEVHNGEVKHQYKLTDRGALIGAYCIAKRHKSSRPMYVFAELKEYSTGKSLWNSQTGKPATMIKKVAESQCLRAAFQDLLGGTYDESEQWEEPRQQQSSNTKQRLKDLANDSPEVHDVSSKTTVQTIVINQDSEDSQESSASHSPKAMGATRNQETIIDNQADETPIDDLQLDEISGLISEKALPAERLEKALTHFGVQYIENLSSSQAKKFIEMLYKL